MKASTRFRIGIEVFELLLTHKADIDATDKHGRTALLYLVGESSRFEERDKFVEIFNLLLEYGANIRVKDFDGITALHVAKHYLR